MITPVELLGLKEKHPDAAVVTYVNSTAQIKAMSDICCTSANAIKVVASIPKEREVIFIPDRTLAGMLRKNFPGIILYFTIMGIVRFMIECYSSML